MTRRERKHFQRDRARVRANRTRHNIARRNTPRVKLGASQKDLAHRSSPGKRNVLEMVVYNAVRMAMQRSPTLQPPPPVRRVGMEAGITLTEVLTIGVMDVLLAVLVYWLITGCTPTY